LEFRLQRVIRVTSFDEEIDALESGADS